MNNHVSLEIRQLHAKAKALYRRGVIYAVLAAVILIFDLMVVAVHGMGAHSAICIAITGITLFNSIHNIRVANKVMEKVHAEEAAAAKAVQVEPADEAPALANEEASAEPAPTVSAATPASA